jgi:putative membrane protein
MDKLINISYVINAIVFSLMGLVIFWLGFRIFDRLTPYHLWKEIIEEKNVALAIVVSGVSIGVCLIIASAIHG